jgi:uncharacterized protein (DUF488 family)
METTIYSIGHGNKKMSSFIKELESFDIQYVMDVRSMPYSKWSPQYNQSTLKDELTNCKINYVYAGDTLGGLPKDKSCYDENGKVVYDAIKEKEFFKEGLSRLITANDKKLRLAIMCSEANPAECHRCKLIGQELLKHNISINHIISAKNTKSQETVMAELTKGKGTVDLWGNETEFTSRKSY